MRKLKLTAKKVSRTESQITISFRVLNDVARALHHIATILSKDLGSPTNNHTAKHQSPYASLTNKSEERSCEIYLEIEMKYR